MANYSRSVLFVRIPDVPRDIEADWNKWYDREHIAYRLVRPGFIGARRYLLAQGPYRYICMYEMASPAALTSPEYLAHRRWEEAQPEGTFEWIAPRLKGFARGVYEQRDPDGADYDIRASNATLIVDLDSVGMSGDELRSLSVAHFESAKRVSGITGARLLALTEVPLTAKSGSKTDRPKALLQYDLDLASSRDVAEVRAELAATPDIGRILPADDVAWLFGQQVYSSFVRVA